MSAIDRRTFLALASSSLAACALPGNANRTARSERVHDFDLLIHGAQVFDGTGAPGESLDLALRGERIAAITARGCIDPDRARRHLDASGLCLAPGFIDIHTHSDNDIFEYPGDESRIYQGITTEVTGNCGGSAAPHSEWKDVAGYFRALEERMVATNQILLVGQGTLRRSVTGLENRPLTAAELTRLEVILDAALAEGAAGLSSGLEYTPGRYSSTDELIALARVVQRRGGFYASHVRNEEAGLLESIDEALRIGTESGVRVQISHLKAAGKPNWPKQASAIRAIERAR
ncbi:MAG: amidohydrolase family protein, partial [Planctomycetia bacterium]